MLLPNQTRLNIIRSQFQKCPQRNQSTKAHPYLTPRSHAAAQTGVKHPRRYLQGGRLLLLLSHATKDLCSAPSCFPSDMYLLAVPRMPLIMHLSEGFMGVLRPSCITANACTQP